MSRPPVLFTAHGNPMNAPGATLFTAGYVDAAGFPVDGLERAHRAPASAAGADRARRTAEGDRPVRLSSRRRRGPGGSRTTAGLVALMLALAAACADRGRTPGRIRASSAVLVDNTTEAPFAFIGPDGRVTGAVGDSGTTRRASDSATGFDPAHAGKLFGFLDQLRGRELEEKGVGLDGVSRYAVSAFLPDRFGRRALPYRA